MPRRAVLSLGLALAAATGAAPVGAQAATVGATTTFPSGVDKPLGIAAGPDGRLWFSSTQTSTTPSTGR